MKLGGSWISPKTRRALPSKIGGLGFFAAEPILKGEMVYIKMGRLIDQRTFLDNKKEIQDSEMQITDDLYIAPIGEEEVADSMVYCNHSCEPNVGFQGQIVGVALRNIESGEELTVDYAMFHDDDILELKCNCQTPSCRRHITGRDWQLPELQQKYKGYFAWFIEQKIQALDH